MTKTETKTFLELLAEVPDHRVGNAIKYSLRDVLFLGIFAILCGAENYTGMHVFSEMHLEELRQYLELTHGVPSHDVFGDVFSRVDMKGVEKCFQIFIESIKEGENKDQAVALDGKTIRRSGNKEHKAAHIETAFLSDLELVLGQMATEEKSNGLTAIPKLLEILALTKCTVTIDAMGTHRDIAEAIHDKGADYILPVKENQPLLLDDIKLYAESDVLPQDKDVLKQAYRYAEVNEKGHGRIEKRECWLFDDAEWL